MCLDNDSSSLNNIERYLHQIQRVSGAISDFIWRQNFHPIQNEGCRETIF